MGNDNTLSPAQEWLAYCIIAGHVINEHLDIPPSHENIQALASLLSDFEHRVLQGERLLKTPLLSTRGDSHYETK